MARAVVFLLGLAGLVCGVALLSVPIAFMVGGGALMLGAVGLEVAASKREPARRVGR